MQEVRRWMCADDAIGVVVSDGELAPEELSLVTAHALREAGPWGQAFPEPLFDGRFRVCDARTVGERHLRLEVRAGDGPPCEAICFRHFDEEGAAVVTRDSQVELAYRLDVNQYNGLERLQLVVEYLRVV